MSKQEIFLFETTAEAKAFVKGVQYVNHAGITAACSDPDPLRVLVTLLEEDELPPIEELYQDMAAYLDFYQGAGFRVDTLEVGDMTWAYWTQTLPDGRVVRVSMPDGIRLPSFDDLTEVRIYQSAELRDETMSKRTFPEPKTALLELCAELNLETPDTEAMDAEYESFG